MPTTDLITHYLRFLEHAVIDSPWRGGNKLSGNGSLNLQPAKHEVNSLLSLVKKCSTAK